jgi:hypothetical protein
VSLTRHPLRAARLSVGLLRSAPALVANPAWPRVPLVDRLLGRDGEPVLSRPGLRAPPTPFNRSITQHRRWGFASLPLAEVRRVKQALGVTVNDVVMALCAGALRRWLLDHDALPDGPLIAAVPVSVRTQEQQGTHGNRVSMMLTVLPTQLAGARDRLQACTRPCAPPRSSTARCRPTCSPTSPSSPCRRWRGRPPGWRRACGWSNGPAPST